jgi:hypothetical protein
MKNECDVFCSRCGTRLIMTSCGNLSSFSVFDGQRNVSDEYWFQCPKYKSFIGIGNGHNKFVSKYEYRHSSWNT